LSKQTSRKEAANKPKTSRLQDEYKT